MRRLLETGLYNMDCLDGMKLIDDGTVDLILTDLPYGITQCEWDKLVPLDLFWEQAKRIIKDHGAIVLTAKQPFTTDLINSNREWYRYNLVWAKNISTGFYNANIMPLQTHEDICVFYKHKPTYNPQMETGFERKVSKASSKRKCQSAEIYNKAICTKDYDSTERYPISLLYFESDKHKNALHPTQKPLAMFEYLIRTFSNKGDLVVDCCSGSNTTGIACRNTDRKYIGFEKEKKYFDIGTERYNQEFSQIKLTDYLQRSDTKKIYISGTITSNPNYKEDFERAEDYLQREYPNAEIINPALVNSYLPKSTTHEEYMRMSFCMLDMADAIFMIDGWQKSCGASQEYGYALAKDKVILFERSQYGEINRKICL